MTSTPTPTPTAEAAPTATSAELRALQRLAEAVIQWHRAKRPVFTGKADCDLAAALAAFNRPAAEAAQSSGWRRTADELPPFGKWVIVADADGEWDRAFSDPWGSWIFGNRGSCPHRDYPRWCYAPSAEGLTL